MATRVTGMLALERALEAEEKRLRAGMVRACRYAAAYGRTKAMTLARASGIRASGTYERSFVVAATPEGATLANSSEHAGIVEEGRRAGRKPPPVQVILLWMHEKGMIGKIPALNVRSHVAGVMKSLKGDSRYDAGSRRRIRGHVEESARQRRLSEREAFIMAAWRRAWKIAKAIGARGLKGHMILGRTVVDIRRFLKAELRKLKRQN